MSAEEAVRVLAEGRYGVFSRREAIERGMSPRAIDRRLASGQLRAIYAGVYMFKGAPQTWESRLMAAELSFDGAAIVSHRSAGAIYQLDGVPTGVIELTIPTGRPSPQGVVLHRIRGECPGKRQVRGFTVTGIERTLLDLCSVLPPKACGRAMDDALRRRLTTLDRLHKLCESSKGRGGCRLFRQLISLRDHRDEQVASRLETKLLRILKWIEGQKFVPQCKVVVDRRTYYIDFGYPREMVGIEAHSVDWHLGDDQFNDAFRR
ncbi:MAG: type IV toxin-antitoxin system AbiEi family antitoxin domain-containing protein [Actinomycetota bacterium]